MQLFYVIIQPEVIKMDEHMQHDKNILNKHFTELNPLVAGWQNCRSGYSFGPAIRDFYVIHYIVSGKGIFKTKKGAFELGAGEYFIIRPGELTFYKADKKTPWNYIWLGFNGNLSSHFDSIPDTGSFTDEQFFLDIKRTDDNLPKYEEYLTGKLFTLYSLMFRDEKESVKHIHKVRNFIKRNYMSELSVEDIAQNLGINRIYLSRIFKEEFGMSIKQYIISVRMNYAKQFLESGYSVAEVAEMVGYSDSFGFSKMFKSHFGISPINLKKTR